MVWYGMVRCDAMGRDTTWHKGVHNIYYLCVSAWVGGQYTIYTKACPLRYSSICTCVYTDAPNVLGTNEYESHSEVWWQADVLSRRLTVDTNTSFAKALDRGGSSACQLISAKLD